MATAPTGNDVAAVYTTAALVDRWLPSNYVVAGTGPSSTKGKVTSDDITDMIEEHSRSIDARLWKAGLQTPFPNVDATNPKLPRQIRRACSLLVASDIAMLIKFGSRTASRASRLKKDAEAIITSLEQNPHGLGKVRVTTPEAFTTPVSSGVREAGAMIGLWYRLANTNVSPKSLRFVTRSAADAPAVEVLRPDGFPFIHGADWEWVSAAQGVIAVANTQILNAIGQYGGVVYEWGWVRLDRYQLKLPSIPGVAR